MVDYELDILITNKSRSEEERITKINAIHLWEHEKLKDLDPYNFNTLLYIHQFLFNDIYEFAGLLRTVDIAKGDTQFCLLRHMDVMVDVVNNMKHKTIEDIINIYIELNLLHPFREGNGRATRIWLNNALTHACKVIINWECISLDEYMYAMIKSPLNDKILKELLLSAITTNVKDKEIFFRGLDKSYEYEELYEFSSEELYEMMKNNKV